MKKPPLTFQTRYGTAFLNKSGYLILPHGYGKNKPAPLHRVIFQDHIKRRIPCDYEVHHINGCKTDNRVENLVALEQKAHRLLHI